MTGMMTILMNLMRCFGMARGKTVTQNSSISTPSKRFSKKTILTKTISTIEHENGCWEPALKPNNEGYIFTTFKQYGKMSLHAASLIEHVGPAPKEGMVPNHKCGNRFCFNPDHLEWVTQSKNTLESFDVERREQRKLSKDEVMEIHRLLLMGLAQQAIADLYGVDRTAICKIKTGKVHSKWTGRTYTRRVANWQDYSAIRKTS